MDSYTLYLALYLVGFAALHSLLASLPVKSIARKRFGSRVDPWYPVFFSATAAVTLLPLVALIIYRPGELLYILPSPWIWIFFALQLLIGLASLKAFLDAPHRFLIRAQLAGPGSPQGFALGIKGIYCWIRDPFLLSGFLLLWLTPFMTENMLPIYLLATVYLFLGSMHWESRLAHQFGEDYAAYKKEVRRMIPGRRWRGCRGSGGSELK